MLVATARRAFDHSLSFARTKAPAMAIQHVLNDTRWRKVSATEHTPAHEVFTAPIEQSVQDKRSYKLIRLENGLQAMLVHDKDADTSAASMDVAVGHLHDPDDMPGLAHFCEHMLFLGTKPFPKENAYNEYINASGGQTNAYTDASNTNYHFTVSSTKTPPSTPAPEAANGDVQVTAPTRKSPLPRALEMFAAFFHSPLFTSTGTNRELNAVDSEHKKNAQNDYWRIFQLNKGLSGHIVDKDGNVKKHPWHKFGTGSRATLSAYGRSVAHRQQKEQEKDKAATANGAANGNGHAVKDITCDPAHPLPALPSESEPDGGPVGIETRRRLVEWWEKEYCAGRMKLAVIGRESLDEQTQLVANLFSPIPNRNQEPWPLITESSFGPEQHGTMVEMKTVMDFRGFDIEWQIPWQSPFYLSKPADFLSHLVGHEGPGSLHSYLKQKGWITYLGAGVTAQGRGRSRFGVNGMLTKEGLENRAAFLDAVFKYVSLLRHSDLPSYLYEEQRQMGEIHFRFSEKQNADDYAIGIATGLNKPYAREHILSGRQRVWEYDEQGVRSLLDELVPSKARVMFCAREFPTMEEGVEEKEWEKETWYGTEYRVRKMPGGLLEAKKNDIGEMFLPRPNEFLPKRLEVNKMEVKEPLKAPTKIHDTPASILYHKKDDQFWVPRAVYYANIITPLGQVTPRNAVKTRMYTNLVNDALTEYSYDATLAGLHYRCYGTERGLFFSVGGYNDKIPVLAGTVLDKMRNIKINKARFEVLREELIQEYENFYLTDPYRYADYLINYLMSDMAWTPREKLAELKTLTPEEVQEHINQLLSRTYVEALAHGNITREEGESMLEMTEKVLASTELTPLERMHDRSLLLPEGANFVYQTSVPNLKEVNSALVYHCHVGLVSDRALISRNALLLHMMREPAFDDLRTKQQLGYIVFVTRAEGRSVFGIRFTIQSEREPVYLESRVEAFLESFRKQLGEMKEEEFEKQKEGLMAAKLQKLENLYSETNRFWSHISNGYLDFRRQEREVEVIRTLKLEDMTTFFDTYLAPTSPQRRKLSIHLRSQHVPKVPTPAKFSVAASEAHLALVQSHGIHVEVDTYRAYCKAEPPVAAVKAFWTGHFKTLPEVKEDVKKTLLDKVEELAREHADVPKEADEKATLRAGTKIIEDVRIFKAGLGLGPAAMPIEEV